MFKGKPTKVIITGEAKEEFDDLNKVVGEEISKGIRSSDHQTLLNSIKLKKETIISALLIIGVFYFSFMILDRLLSIIYGFNFQPFGPHMPPGFTIWGHLFNGSLVALGLFLTFKLYDYGKEKEILFLQILALGIFFTIGAIIPYMNDAAYIERQGMGNTIPVYIIFNVWYVFSWGPLMFKIAKSIKWRALIWGVMFLIFLLIHFAIYAPMFPEFYWS